MKWSLLVLSVLSLIGSQASAQELIAHRGMHQNWFKGAYSRRDGCEALHMMPPTHGFIENTAPAIQAAFDKGATMVEVDLRQTKDQHLVVMHDADLTCKTDGKGMVWDKNLEDLRKLDLGYGFTHDGGKSFPSRGKGKGLLISFSELLKKFPDKKFLLDLKDGSVSFGTLVGKELKTLSPQRQEMIRLWATREQELEIQKWAPGVSRLFPSRGEMKRCVMPYMSSGGKKAFGDLCKGMALGLNRDYARMMPGFPHKFMENAKKLNNPLYWMVDNKTDFEYFKKVPAQGLVTDWIEIIGPMARTQP